MFLDVVVVFGIITVLLMCAFFVGVYLYIKEDIKKHGTGEDSVSESKAGKSS